ncbi:hypothetical protein E2562_037809 [Oryza meyeriana var. granulata]|uniref:Uncharacterized protein n=1 Tax=Oryza meyeriana var. granulata TaxID=110450 RepID=A0A6G1DU03_9ORYZ|nr:hypothetical protein E2562_037809 [Oryza meyeriana var. granulata]
MRSGMAGGGGGDGDGEGAMHMVQMRPVGIAVPGGDRPDAIEDGTGAPVVEEYGKRQSILPIIVTAPEKKTLLEMIR